MSARLPLRGLRRRLARFARDTAGAGLVEFTIVLAVFLLLLFGLIDFGRMAQSWVMAEKATQTAARIATVRPPVCDVPEWPEVNTRGTASPAPDFGTHCRNAPGTCADVGPFECLGDATNPTSVEIFARIAPLLPNGSTPANLRYRYTSDPQLGFLGGPYVPIVTVELADVDFTFISPLGAFAALAGVQGAGGGFGTVPMPPMSVSLPGEDLNLGMGG